MEERNINTNEKVKVLNTMLKGKTPCFVFVIASWCGACTRMKEQGLDDFMNDPSYPSNVYTVSDEVFDNTDLANYTSIDSYPTMLKVVPSEQPDRVIVEKVQRPSGENFKKDLETMAKELLKGDMFYNTKPMVYKGGGNLYQNMYTLSKGILPAAFLGSVSLALRGGGKRKSRKRNNSKKRKSRKN